MIVRVFGDGCATDVPVTPETTCSDVIECCRDPGDETCALVAVNPERGGKSYYLNSNWYLHLPIKKSGF